MFIRAVQKKDKNKSKVYTYYRLTHSYRIGDKNRQTVLLNLGKLDTIGKSDHKALANRIEEIITGAENSLFQTVTEEVENLAQSFAKQISREKIFSPTKGKLISNEIKNTYQNIDLDTIEQIESKDMGGEWLMKQAMEKLGVENILTGIGMTQEETNIAQMLLTAKAIYPSSELESERWLDESSATKELFNTTEKISRYKLYKAATQMYSNKTDIDSQLYNNVSSVKLIVK